MSKCSLCDPSELFYYTDCPGNFIYCGNTRNVDLRRTVRRGQEALYLHILHFFLLDYSECQWSDLIGKGHGWEIILGQFFYNKMKSKFVQSECKSPGIKCTLELNTLHFTLTNGFWSERWKQNLHKKKKNLLMLKKTFSKSSIVIIHEIIHCQARET